MNDPLKINEIQFYDHCIPSLAAGTYTITVSHRVDTPDIHIPDACEKVKAGGSRFALDSAAIHSVYPPKNSSGQFAGTLPHIILNKRSLPWERGLAGQARNIPWMALLLFEKAEIKETMTLTVAELLGNETSCYVKPELSDISAEDLKTTCNCIEIDGQVFDTVVPRLTELEYLAHCRCVSTENKAGNSTANQHYAVLLGNRFPSEKELQTGKNGNNLIHLVSLEGYENYLSSGMDPQKKIRLISLASWSFTCLPEGRETFRHLAQDLMTQANRNRENLMLKLPITAPVGSDINAPEYVIVGQYLSRGYVALNYHTPTGEETFAWYRGPLTPQERPLIAKSHPFHSATAAIIYDEKAGLFDLSLATAWQIGRALALSNREFSSKLVALYQKWHHLTGLLMERFGLDNPDPTADLAELVRTDSSSRRFLELLSEGGIVQAIRKAGTEHLADSGANPSSSGPVVEQVDPVADLRQLLGRKEVQELLRQQLKAELDELNQYLTRMRLLYNIPFYYLIPDPRMLPSESVRFFHVDQNWLEAFIDGALAIGIHTSRELLSQNALRGFINQALLTVKSGFFIRSALVSGWPGLKIKAFRSSGEELHFARMDRLSGDILFCLFEGVPDKVEISEPEEQFHCGVDEEGYIALRYLKEKTGAVFGQMQIYNTKKTACPDFIRQGNGRVLNIEPDPSGGRGLVSELSKQVKNGQPLTASGFAIQMVKTPAQFVFRR